MRGKHRTVGPEPVSAFSLAGGRERAPRKLEAAGGARGGGRAGAAPAQRSLALVAPRRRDTGRGWKGAGRPAGAQGAEGGAAPPGGPAVRPAQMQGDAGCFCVTTGERRCDLLMQRAPQCMRLVLMKGSPWPCCLEGSILRLTWLLYWRVHNAEEEDWRGAFCMGTRREAEQGCQLQQLEAAAGVLRERYEAARAQADGGVAVLSAERELARLETESRQVKQWRSSAQRACSRETSCNGTSTCNRELPGAPCA